MTDKEKPLIEYGDERRRHDDLREMVKGACDGVSTATADRIKLAARKAYYLGCKDGMDIARTYNNRGLAEKTIDNCQEVVEGHKALASPDTLTETEKQHAYVNAQLSRCRRCGAHTPTVLPSPPLSMVCPDCESTMRTGDAGVMWFVDLIARIDQQDKEKKQ